MGVDGRHWVGIFSDFADQAIILPLEIVVLLILVMDRRLRDAAVWAGIVVLGSVVMCLLKLWFERCGVPPHRVFYSPSGHTFGGTLVYGGVVSFFCRRRLSVLLWAICLAALFGGSRVILGLHTVPEAVSGGMIGIGAVLALYQGRKDRQTRLPWIPATFMLIAAVVLCVALHGYRLGAESWIESFSHRLGRRLYCGG